MISIPLCLVCMVSRNASGDTQTLSRSICGVQQVYCPQALDHSSLLYPIHWVAVAVPLCSLAALHTYVACNIPRCSGSLDRYRIRSEIIAFLSRFFQRQFIEFLQREEGAAGKPGFILEDWWLIARLCVGQIRHWWLNG